MQPLTYALTGKKIERTAASRSASVSAQAQTHAQTDGQPESITPPVVSIE